MLATEDDTCRLGCRFVMLLCVVTVAAMMFCICVECESRCIEDVVKKVCNLGRARNQDMSTALRRHA